MAFALRCTLETSIMKKNWRERLFGWPRSPKRKRGYRPCFEQLQERLTPVTVTNFTWTNADTNGLWESGKNWLGSDGTSYPGWNGTAATMMDVAASTKTGNC